MKLSFDIIPNADQIKLIQGVESQLLQNRRKGTIGGIVTLAATLLIQLLIASTEKDYLTNIGKFFNNLVHFRFDQLIGPDGLPVYEFTGLLVLVAGFGVFFLFKWRNFLIKESEESFQYTFCIEQFKPVSDIPDKKFNLKNDDQFHLLHHDLMERLNSRIGRLWLLKEAPNFEEQLTSHIHISGHYAIREEKNSKWVIHVMPRIRIGPPGKPEKLAKYVKFPLSGEVLNAVQYKQMVERIYSSVATEIYRQIFLDVQRKIHLFPTSYLRAVALFHEAKDFERSNTIDSYDYAIKFYRRSKNYFDMKMFGWISQSLLRIPLLWRLVAKSQIMEARARIGYSRCLIYRRIISSLSGRSGNALFEIPQEIDKVIPNLIRLHNRINYKWHIGQSQAGQKYLFNWDKIPGSDNRRLIEYLRHNYKIHWVMTAKIEKIDKGSAIRIYTENGKKSLSLKLNDEKTRVTLEIDDDKKEDFIVKTEDNKLILFLQYDHGEIRKRYKTLMAFLTFPKDSLLRRNQQIYNRQKETLFDAYTVASLAYSQLNAIKLAKKFRDDAKAVDPVETQKNAMWLLAAALIEPDINQKLLLLQQATEMAPDFEIAQYLLADFSEIRLRKRNEINKERVESVINEYEEVLKINPANIGAIMSQGYLWWLLKDLEEAKKKFEEGLEIKAVISQTYIGDLNYGLARISSEKGEFNKSYDMYMQAISSDPGVGAYSYTTGRRAMSSYYDYIVSDMLERYKDLSEKVEEKIDALLNLPDAERIDTENKKVSSKTLNSVHSFVLNDYGNACINFFIRFGDREKLNNAINAFENAIKKDRENAVAYYNLSKAYENRNESNDRDKLLECIKKAEVLANAWPIVRILSIQTQVRRIQNEISKNEYGRKRLEEEKEEKEKEEKKKEEKEKEEKEKEEKELEKKYLFSCEGIPRNDSVRLIDYQKKKKYGEIEKLKEEIQEYETKLKKIDVDIENSKKTLPEVFQKFQKIMDQTNFISLYKNLKIDYSGSGVNEFCKIRIDRGKLNETDIDILTSWAEILTNNKDALYASEKLCQYIQKNFNPENFDTNLIFYRIYGNLEKLKKHPTGLYNQKKENYKEEIKAYIKHWLVQDPIHYFSLKWARKCFDMKEHIKEHIKNDKVAFAVHNGIDEYKCDLKRFLNDDGNKYCKQGKYENSIEKYQEAIDVDPDDAVIHSKLAQAWNYLEPSIEAEQRKEALDNAIKALQSALKLRPQDKDYEERLKWHQRKRRHIEYFGEKGSAVPVITPIAVEVANDLVQFVAPEPGTSGLHQDTRKKIEDMRDDFLSNMGVRVPGIRFRNDVNLSPGSYVITLGDIPYIWGTISLEKRLFEGSNTDLAELGNSVT